MIFFFAFHPAYRHNGTFHNLDHVKTTNISSFFIPIVSLLTKKFLNLHPGLNPANKNYNSLNINNNGNNRQ